MFLTALLKAASCKRKSICVCVCCRYRVIIPAIVIWVRYKEEMPRWSRRWIGLWGPVWKELQETLSAVSMTRVQEAMVINISCDIIILVLIITECLFWFGSLILLIILVQVHYYLYTNNLHKGSYHRYDQWVHISRVKTCVIHEAFCEEMFL